MAEKLFTDVSDNIAETWHYDDGLVHVQRTQDVEPIIDAVAKANLAGTIEVPGLGRLIAEIPIATGIAYCEERGIPWEPFLYSPDYQDERARFMAQHQRLTYAHPKKYH